MKKSTFRKVEDILRDYPKIDRHIEKREQELRYPIKPTDENIGGGRAQNKRAEPVETMVITIDEDEALNAFKRQRDVIDDCLGEVGSDTETIIKELYFKHYPQFTLNGLVENNLLTVGKQQAYNLRNNFIKDVAKGLGLYDL
ncbi:transcriptional regulator [Liquorilactobacillus hordei]|uniref:transcriptional regulator n=1 Tax=Liquorilactobacillus hordei TaxID=468911 RepID=UPI0039E8BDE6